MSRKADEDFALVLGVSRYTEDQFAQLYGPPRDCRDFIRWLRETGVPKKNIFSVVWSQSKPMPYPNTSLAYYALSQLLREHGVDDVSGGRRLYLFAAGHCQSGGAIDAEVVTAECRFPTGASFTISEIAQRIRASGKFEEVVLLVDGCRLGSPSGGAACLLELPADHERAAQTKVFWGFACQYERLAYEKKIDRNVRGIFSHAVMEGLRGAACTKRGRITGGSLERYLRKRVAMLRLPETDQTPEIYCPQDIVLV